MTAMERLVPALKDREGYRSLRSQPGQSVELREIVALAKKREVIGTMGVRRPKIDPWPALFDTGSV